MSGVADRAWVWSSLSRYWSLGGELLQQLPIPHADAVQTETLPPRVEMVTLPDWAADVGVEGGLLVPCSAVCPGDGPAFDRTDWWDAAAWYLEGRGERAHERAHGPIHSYSIRLRGWDSRLWDHAWVNRIALFLRRSAARHFQCEEASAFGPVPGAEIVLTHDVDAVRKTLRIRFKQSAFELFNAARALGTGKADVAVEKAAHGVRFAVRPGDYRTFDRLCAMEEALGLRSTFHVYAGGTAESMSGRLIFDPAYDVRDPSVSQPFRRLSQEGWRIGLHQSFDAWADAGEMRAQKAVLEQALGSEVQDCRQHWLRFSWMSTWAAQEAAGLALDTTMGFNDRPGFRTGAALRVCPRGERGQPRRLATLPLVLMDSHLYDYAEPGTLSPAEGIARWVGEIRAVGGTATVLWHPHVLSDDYGWAPGYQELLRAVV